MAAPFASPPAVRVPVAPQPHQHLMSCLGFGRSNRCAVVCYCWLICIFLMAYNVDNRFICLFTICISIFSVKVFGPFFFHCVICVPLLIFQSQLDQVLQHINLPRVLCVLLGFFLTLFWLYVCMGCVCSVFKNLPATTPFPWSQQRLTYIQHLQFLPCSSLYWIPIKFLPLLIQQNYCNQGHW